MSTHFLGRFLFFGCKNIIPSSNFELSVFYFLKVFSRNILFTAATAYNIGILYFTNNIIIKTTKERSSLQIINKKPKYYVEIN
jgi:hypothetical protein